MNQKYFKILIVSLAVAVVVPQIALAAWWNPFSWGFWSSIFHRQIPTTQQQTNKLIKQTTGWETYRNTQYGFEFQYPGDFANIDDLTAAQKNSLMTYMGTCTKTEKGLCYIGKQTSDGFTTASLSIVPDASISMQDCEKSEPSGPDGELTGTQQTTVNGIIFYEAQLSQAGLGHYVSTDSYRTYHGGVCYTIDLNIESDRGVSEKGLSADFSSIMHSKLKSILSTFKFTTPSAQLFINVFSPKDGDAIHIGQITEISWDHYTPENGDDAIFDITEISSSGQKVVASVFPAQVECNGHQAAACSYEWIPTQASQQDKISVSERGANRIGYSGTFSVIYPALLKPSITNISPSQGGVNNIITINGNNLSEAISIAFYQNGQLKASAPASYILTNNQYQLTFNTNSFLVYSGTYQVKVYTAAGYSNSADFNISTQY